ncbi:hypothetical protein D3C80_2187200 [compost metagenome]
MIQRIAAVRIRPCKVEARTRLNDMSQASRPISAVSRKTTGMAYLAGQRKPTSNMPASTSGTNARIESNV